MEQILEQIEAAVRQLDPAIEVIAVDKAGPEALRIYVDHPDGVDLGLCEKVNGALVDLTARFGLEVSSPGLDRPLTKPSHYQRFLGSSVRIRTREAIAGRKTFTGRLEAADERAVRVADEAGEHEIPLAVVHRSNLVPEFSEVSK